MQRLTIYKEIRKGILAAHQQQNSPYPFIVGSEPYTRAFQRIHARYQTPPPPPQRPKIIGPNHKPKSKKWPKQNRP